MKNGSKIKSYTIEENLISKKEQWILKLRYTNKKTFKMNFKTKQAALRFLSSDYAVR